MRTLLLPCPGAPAPRTGATAELLLGGDFCPVGRFARRLLAGQAIFQPALGERFRRTFSLVNLEAPLCHAETPSECPSGAGLRGDPALAARLKAMGLAAVGLANNHVRDFGADGVRQTLAHVTQAGLLHAGAGMTLREAEEPLAVTLNGLRVGIWPLAEKELNLAGATTAGAAWFHPERNLDVLRELRARFDFLLVYLHAGHEFVTVPSPRVRQACRAFLAAGADAVIGHHPHVMQGLEWQGHGLIAYSLGNLAFDTPYQAAHAGTAAGYLLHLTIARHRVAAAEVIPYRQRTSGLVSPLTAREFADFAATCAQWSATLGDEQAYQAAWAAGVRDRWPEYRRILRDLSRNFQDPAHPELIRRCRNLFASPTHAEMIEHCLLMVEAGQLSRAE